MPHDTCLACCRAAPSTIDAWNPVVASLIYRAASHRLRHVDEGSESASRLIEPRARAAAASLDFADDGSTKECRPVRHFESLRELIPPYPDRHPEPIRRWAVGVTTSPRPRPTLEACLDNLDRAGWSSPHLFIDAAVRVPGRFGHLTGTLRSPAAGTWPNHYLSLLELTMRHPEADAYLIMQDDAR